MQVTSCGALSAYRGLRLGGPETILRPDITVVNAISDLHLDSHCRLFHSVPSLRRGGGGGGGESFNQS